MGEHGGLLGVVAAESQAEAHDTVDLPSAVNVLAVQGSARVSLNNITMQMFSYTQEGMLAYS